MRRDIRKRLTKGLTGKEAARLILEDSWEVDRGREGFLSDADIQRIKSSLNTPQDIQDYNRWIDTYRIIDFNLKDATILALDVSRRMYEHIPYLLQFYLHWRVQLVKQQLPKPVTEKQYQDIKAGQREEKLDEPYNFWGMVESWAFYADVHPDEEELDETGYLSDYLMARHPEPYKEWLSGLIQLIQAGRLHPASYTQEDRARLDILEAKIDVLREKKYPSDREALEGIVQRLREGEPGPENWTEQEEDEWDRLWEEKKALTEQAEKRAREQPEDGQKSTIAALEQLRAGTPVDEASRILGWTSFSTRELYEAGLPECREWVDTFYPDYNGPRYYAIVQEPPEHQVDERGYWKEERWLESFSQLESFDEGWRENLGVGLRDWLQEVHKGIRSQLRNFLAGRDVMELISEYMGINFVEALDSFLTSVLQTVEQYNGYLGLCNQELGRGLVDKDKRLRLPLLRPQMLKPDKDEIEKLKARLALGMGDDWTAEANVLLRKATQEGEEAEAALEQYRQKEQADG